MLPLILFILFILITDIYSYFGLRSALFAQHLATYTIIYIIISVLTISGILVMIKSFSHLPSNQSFGLNLIIGLTFSIIIAKLHFSTLFLIEDILRGFLWLFQSALNFRLTEFISRSYIWALFSLGSGILIATLLNYGVVFGKYHFKVHHKTLTFDHLPIAFNGFKIAQVSDMHLGSFDNIKKVEKGLHMLQNENPDVIVFTGDLVNNKADEALIYIDAMKNLRAPYGKYTIMGNHDYGDYARWNSQKERTENIEQLNQIQQQMGFQWLNNAHSSISKENDTIYIAGVENWGLPPFPQYGNIQTTLNGIKESDFVVLLSHDPTHWREQVLKTLPKIALTLSGHTHGMQFGIEIGKFKWSPVKYKYKDWAGLFEKNNQYLYVNRGYGNIGYPGRLGIRPEITIIELRCKDK
ncbi:MAG: metallophosphoesterase [Salinivirgaceae bacterium]|jgi:predicted MPP superfamily phosphohydrolase|nr:metallophosphoesterase [Salinivirgaceae bacterium]